VVLSEEGNGRHKEIEVQDICGNCKRPFTYSSGSDKLPPRSERGWLNHYLYFLRILENQESQITQMEEGGAYGL
jgi:hypothetical protein